MQEEAVQAGETIYLLAHGCLLLCDKGRLIQEAELRAPETPGPQGVMARP